MKNSNGTRNKINSRYVFALIGLLMIFLICGVIYLCVCLAHKDNTKDIVDFANSSIESDTLQSTEDSASPQKEDKEEVTDITTETDIDELVSAETEAVTARMQWDYSTKLPNEYTKEEYEALSEEQKDAFVAWFGSHEDYLNWELSVTEAETELELPWMNGHKTPENYTYEEFELLTAEQQDAFFEWFASYEDFLEWEDKAGDAEPVGDYPWTCGGKSPDQYTYTEFETLSPELQDAFFEWFPTFEEYMKWEDNA